MLLKSTGKFFACFWVFATIAHAQMLVKSSDESIILIATEDQKVGIGLSVPAEQLDVQGAIKIGTTALTNAGAIRWSGLDFEGYNGSQWQSLTAMGGSLWSQNGSAIFYNAGNVGIGTSAPASPLTVYGSQNGLTLAYDLSNLATLQVESDGDLLVNPSSKRVLINSQNLNQASYPNARLIVVAEQQPILSDQGVVAIEGLVRSLTSPWVVGINGVGEGTVGGQNSFCIGISGISMARAGVEKGVGVRGLGMSYGNLESIGGEFSIYRDFNALNADFSGTCAKLATNLTANSFTQRICGLLIADWEASGATVQNSYGIFLDNSIDIGSASRFALYCSSNSPSYLAGMLGIGTSAPATPLHIYGASNTMRLGYDASNYSDFFSTNDGALVINPSQKRLFINDQGVNKSGYPYTALVITSDNVIGVSNGNETGIVCNASSSDKDAIGIMVNTASEKPNGQTTGISIWANGYVNVASATALSAIASGNGAKRIYGGKFSIYQGNSSGNPYPSGSNLALNLMTGIGVIMDSVRIVDFSNYDKLHQGSVNNSFGLYLDTSIDIGNTTRYAIYSKSTSNSYLEGNLGIGVETPQRNLHVKDIMRLEPRTSAPASASEGDMYYNATDHKLYVFDGSAWQGCW